MVEAPWRTLVLSLLAVAACHGTAPTMPPAGDDGGPSPLAMQPPAPVHAISVGSDRGCAIRGNDDLWCWPDADGHTAGPIAISSGWISIGVGDRWSCGVRDDSTLWCWPGREVHPAPRAGNWQSVTVGTEICAVALDHTVHCWDDMGGESTAPDDHWVIASAGGDLSCAIRDDGTLWCWVPGSAALPSQIDGSGWTSISAGAHHVCGSRSDGEVCFGGNSDDQIASWLPPVVSTPTLMWTDPGAIVAGGAHTCLASPIGTRVLCKGNDQYGQLGNGQLDPQGSSDWLWISPVAIAAGADVTCALDAQDAIWCWGRDDTGQVGDGGPVPSAFGSSWVAAVSGEESSCGIQQDRSLWCWGIDSCGLLGGGTNAVPPLQIGSAQWLALGNGGSWGCGVQSDHSLWCWGCGHLGVASPAWSGVPVQVGGTDWATVCGGELHGCAIKTDHTMWCWGANGSGELGNGTTTDSATPVQVIGGDWASVSCGGDTCGIKLDGSLWCWGYNGGTVGDGTNINRTSPVEISSDAWTSVATSFRGYTCATKADGTLWCWGANYYGQLGDPAITSSSTPHQLPGADWSQATVAVNLEQSCATRRDGTLWCWGEIVSGLLWWSPMEMPGDHWSSASTGNQVCALDGTSLTCGSATFGAGTYAQYSPVKITP